MVELLQKAFPGKHIYIALTSNYLFKLFEGDWGVRDAKGNTLVIYCDGVISFLSGDPAHYYMNLYKKVVITEEEALRIVSREKRFLYNLKQLG